MCVISACWIPKETDSNTVADIIVDVRCEYLAIPGVRLSLSFHVGCVLIFKRLLKDIPEDNDDRLVLIIANLEKNFVDMRYASAMFQNLISVTNVHEVPISNQQ
jgi:hypothetical protein